MTIRTIDAAQLKSWLDAGAVTLVDVREGAEFRSAHINGAVHVPLGQLSAAQLPATAGRRLVMQCAAGRRGGMACEKLLAQDPSLDIYNLDGGLAAWQAAGLPLAQGGKSVLPLDRQVQVTIGLFLLLATVLTLAVDAKFVLIAGFFGAGLALAGLTGFCGLALLLAKMPWNR